MGKMLILRRGIDAAWNFTLKNIFEKIIFWKFFDFWKNFQKSSKNLSNLEKTKLFDRASIETLGLEDPWRVVQHEVPFHPHRGQEFAEHKSLIIKMYIRNVRFKKLKHKSLVQAANNQLKI